MIDSIVTGETVTPGGEPDALRRARRVLWALLLGAAAVGGAAVVWSVYIGLAHGYGAANATLTAVGTFLGALVALGAAIGAGWAYFLNTYPGLTLFAGDDASESMVGPGNGAP